MLRVHRQAYVALSTTLPSRLASPHYLFRVRARLAATTLIDAASMQLVAFHGRRIASAFCRFAFGFGNLIWSELVRFVQLCFGVGICLFFVGYPSGLGFCVPSN